MAIGDYYLTPNKQWKDKCWGESPISERLIGLAFKSQKEENIEGVIVVIWENFSFDKANLTLLPKVDFKVGDLIRVKNDGSIQNDIRWGTHDFVEGNVEQVKRIGKIETIQDNYCRVRWPDGRDNSYQPTSLVYYVALPIEKRISSHIHHKEFLIPLLKKLETNEIEYKAVRSMPTNGDRHKEGLVFFNAEKTEVSIKYPNQETITLIFQKDTLKAYKEFLDDKVKRFRGICVKKEQAVKLMTEHSLSWKTKYGDDDIGNLNTATQYKEDFEARVAHCEPLIKTTREVLDFFAAIELAKEAKGILVPEAVAEWKRANEKDNLYQRGRIETFRKSLEGYIKQIETLKQKIAKGDTKNAKRIEEDYEVVCDLFKAKVIEELGVDKDGFLFVIFSPLIMTYNRLKSCPEYGPKCTCLVEKRKYYYLGRVKVSFHHLGRCVHANCKGFGFESLSWPKTIVHPHLRREASCHDGCYNGYEELKREVLKKGSLSSLIMFIRQFLTNYNPHHGLIGIENFKYCEIVDKKAPSGLKDESFDIKFIEKMFGPLTRDNNNVTEKTKRLVLAGMDGELEDEDDDGDDV